MKRFLRLFVLASTALIPPTCVGMERICEQARACLAPVPLAIPETPQELVSWYAQLTKKDTQALRTEIAQLQTSGTNYEARIHPLWLDENIQQLTRYAHKILDACPDDRIFCLGQSQAYLFETARIIRAQNNRNTDNMRFIAFSGKFFVPTYDAYKKNDCFEQTAAPSSSQIKCYRKYLASIGMAPGTIVEHAQLNGQKTIIIEYVVSGCGLASFLWILREWAYEEGLTKELENSLVLNITSYGKRSIHPHEFGNFEQTGWSFDEDVSSALFFSLSTNDAADDRLVMKYRYPLWDKQSTLNFHPSRVTQLLRFHIIDYLMKIIS